MRLWTYQSIQSVKELEDTGVLKVSKNRYSPGSAWRICYEWMRKEMILNGIDCGDYLPIWAWHSCRAYGHPPTEEDGVNLLSLLEIEAGIKLITFDCPDNLVLLSRYDAWNDIIYQFLDEKKMLTPDPKFTNVLYKTSPQDSLDQDAIQATLPYLKLEWVEHMEVFSPSDL